MSVNEMRLQYPSSNMQSRKTPLPFLQDATVTHSGLQHPMYILNLPENYHLPTMRATQFTQWEDGVNYMGAC